MRLLARCGDDGVARSAVAGQRSAVTSIAQQAPAAPRAVTIPADARSRLNAGDLQAIEAFLERRLDMSLEARQALAARLVASTAKRMNVPPAGAMHPETFLEEVAYGMRAQGRLR
jgi:hypothetical protein